MVREEALHCSSGIRFSDKHSGDVARGINI